MNTGTFSADEYRAMREAIGFSQTDLAEALGVTRGTISNRERGLVPIGTEATIAIASLWNERQPQEVA